MPSTKTELNYRRQEVKAFITGGAGFIGSHLVDRLLGEGNQVTILDNFSSGKREFIKRQSIIPLSVFVQDLVSSPPQKIRTSMRGHNIVFHLAANPEARKGITDTRLDLEQETIVTYKVLEAMRRTGVKKIVFSSSGTIYGETPVIPLPEHYGPVLPTSLYGAGKLACEGLISAYCHTFGMQAWIFRFANVVGPRMTHGVIYDFIHKLRQNPRELEILGDGAQEKPYLHVSDCIDGILYALQHSNDRVNVFNLGHPSSVDVTTIATILCGEMGLHDVKFRFTGGDRGWPGDIPQVRFDTSKINRLGWKARHSSIEAVRMAIKEMLRDSVTSPS